MSTIKLTTTAKSVLTANSTQSLNLNYFNDFLIAAVCDDVSYVKKKQCHTNYTLNGFGDKCALHGSVMISNSGEAWAVLTFIFCARLFRESGSNF